MFDEFRRKIKGWFDPTIYEPTPVYIVDISKPPIFPPSVFYYEGAFALETDFSVRARAAWREYMKEYKIHMKTIDVEEVRRKFLVNGKSEILSDLDRVFIRKVQYDQLVEAIAHAQEVADQCFLSDCGKEHKQLADWLIELKNRRDSDK